MTRRKVVCVFGKFDDKSDFVLEPVCEDKNCEYCKDAFWIEKVEGEKEDEHKKNNIKHS